MKKNKKVIVFVSVILAVLLLGILIYFYGTSQTLLSLPNRIDIQPEEISESWNGIPITLTGYFGEYVSGQRNSDDLQISICRDRDGRVRLNNDYEISEKLTVSSITSTTKIGCGPNEIKITGDFPKGTLKGDCSLMTTNGVSYCEIMGYDKIENYFHNDDETKTKSKSFQINLDSPKTISLVVSTSPDNKGYGSAILSLEFEEFAEEEPIEVPVKPEKPTFTGILSKIFDWIKSLFSRGVSQTILGSSVVTPNTQETYDISLSTTIPDSDYSDGTYQIQYANWVFLDKNQNILNEGNWEEVKGTYNKKVTLTIPSNPSDYILVAVIYQYNQVYNFNTNSWVTDEGTIIQKEAIDIETKIPIPEQTIIPSFTNLLSRIWDWFKNLFNF